MSAAAYSFSIIPDSNLKLYFLLSRFNSVNLILQQKLERELGDITKKFDEKKKKFLDSSDEFAKKLKVVGIHSTWSFILSPPLATITFNGTQIGSQLTGGIFMLRFGLDICIPDVCLFIMP